MREHKIFGNSGNNGDGPEADNSGTSMSSAWMRWTAGHQKQFGLVSARYCLDRIDNWTEVAASAAYVEKSDSERWRFRSYPN